VVNAEGLATIDANGIALAGLPAGWLRPLA